MHSDSPISMQSAALQQGMQSARCTVPSPTANPQAGASACDRRGSLVPAQDGGAPFPAPTKLRQTCELHTLSCACGTRVMMGLATLSELMTRPPLPPKPRAWHHLPLLPLGFPTDSCLTGPRGQSMDPHPPANLAPVRPLVHGAAAAMEHLGRVAQGCHRQAARGRSPSLVRAVLEAWCYLYVQWPVPQFQRRVRNSRHCCKVAVASGNAAANAHNPGELPWLHPRRCCRDPSTYHHGNSPACHPLVLAQRRRYTPLTQFSSDREAGTEEGVVVIRVCSGLCRTVLHCYAAPQSRLTARRP